jgi:hypothetical protein
MSHGSASLICKMMEHTTSLSSHRTPSFLHPCSTNGNARTRSIRDIVSSLILWVSVPRLSLPHLQDDGVHHISRQPSYAIVSPSLQHQQERPHSVHQVRPIPPHHLALRGQCHVLEQVSANTGICCQRQPVCHLHHAAVGSARCPSALAPLQRCWTPQPDAAVSR